MKFHTLLIGIKTYSSIRISWNNTLIYSLSCFASKTEISTIYNTYIIQQHTVAVIINVRCNLHHKTQSTTLRVRKSSNTSTALLTKKSISKYLKPLMKKEKLLYFTKFLSQIQIINH